MCRTEIIRNTFHKTVCKSYTSSPIQVMIRIASEHRPQRRPHWTDMRKQKAMPLQTAENRCVTEWLFTKWNGEIMNLQTPTKQFRLFLKKHGLKHRKLHALRHTSATLLLYGGINIRQVQSRLGHSELETTQKYLHCLSEADVEAVNVLTNMLEPNRRRSIDLTAGA